MYKQLSPEEAVRDEAERFPFTFITNENFLIGADSLTGICEAFIEGYADIEEPTEPGPDPFLAARVDALTQIANLFQAGVVASISADNPQLLESLSEDEMTALMHPKGAEVLEFDEWTRNDIPLVLMATDYAPYNIQEPAPSGDGVVWVNAHDERRFVLSLEKLGVGKLFIDEARLEEVQLAAEET